ncbi:MAG: hypothetical protein AAF211_10930, partial [Myxococcota bacterium]
TRADARLVPEHSHGLSRNRMAGLAAAQGALVLFSDDDIHLDMAGIDALRAALPKNLRTDVLILPDSR